MVDLSWGFNLRRLSHNLPIPTNSRALASSGIPLGPVLHFHYLKLYFLKNRSDWLTDSKITVPPNKALQTDQQSHNVWFLKWRHTCWSLICPISLSLFIIMKLCRMGKSYQNMHVLMTKITGNITIKILVAKMIQG